MQSYRYDHIHIRTRDPEATMAFFERMFGARRIPFVQSNGKPRVDLDLNGLAIFLAEVPAEGAFPAAPDTPYEGFDHIGLRVDDVDAAVAELKAKGADIIRGPITIRPDVRIAFVKGPDHLRIELLQRDRNEISAEMGR